MADSVEVRSTERRLVRRKENRLIAGVAGGLADYTGLDPAIFRVAFLALMLFAGGGVVLYLLAWLLIPAAGSPESYGERLLKRIARAPWVAGAVVAGLAFLAAWGAGVDFGQPVFGWALVLIAIGVVLLRRDRPAVADSPSADVATTAKFRLIRDRSPLGWIVLGIAIIGTGVGALAHNVGAVHLEVGDYAALSLVIIGVGLALGAWIGRARWLIPIGLAMVPLVVMSSLIDMPLRGAIGSQSLYPASLEQLPERYELLAGTLYVDLSQVDFEGRTARLDIRAGAGNVNIAVPRSVLVRVDARSNFGYVHAFGRYNDGFDSRVVTERLPEDPTGTLVLDIQGGFGDISVYRTYTDYPRPKARRDERRGASEKGRDGRRDRRNDDRDGRRGRRK